MSKEYGSKDGLTVCGPRVYNIDFKEFELMNFECLLELKKIPENAGISLQDFLDWDVWVDSPGSTVRNAKVVETSPKVKLQLERLLFLDANKFGRQNMTYTASLEYFPEVVSESHEVQIYKLPACDSSIFIQFGIQTVDYFFTMSHGKKLRQGKIHKEIIASAFSTVSSVIQIHIDKEKLDYCGKVTIDLKKCDGSPLPSFITYDSTIRSSRENLKT